MNLSGHALDPSDPQHGDPLLFSAVLRPHRSLTPKGIRLVIALVAVAGLVAAIPFIIFGFWPVAGFYGLDIALLYWALNSNMDASGTFEIITVSPYALDVEKRPRCGRSQFWTFNPLWTRLHKDFTADMGLEKLVLVSKGERVTIADTLNPEDKADFGKALQLALDTAKRGPIHNHGHDAE